MCERTLAALGGAAFFAFCVFAPQALVAQETVVISGGGVSVGGDRSTGAAPNVTVNLDALRAAGRYASDARRSYDPSGRQLRLPDAAARRAYRITSGRGRTRTADRKPPEAATVAAAPPAPAPLPVMPPVAEREPTPIMPPDRRPEPAAPALKEKSAASAVADRPVPASPSPPAKTQRSQPPSPATPAPDMTTDVPALRRAVEPPAVDAPDAPAPPRVAALPPVETTPAARETANSIRFEAGSAILGSDAASRLDRAAADLAAGERRIQLLAYAAETESPSGARRLSLKRALTVRAYLIEQGIRSTRIDVRALGAPDDGGPVDRVDIVIK